MSDMEIFSDAGPQAIQPTTDSESVLLDWPALWCAVLPYNVSMLILSHLSLDDRLHCEAVCSMWRDGLLRPNLSWDVLEISGERAARLTSIHLDALLLKPRSPSRKARPMCETLTTLRIKTRMPEVSLTQVLDLARHCPRLETLDLRGFMTIPLHEFPEVLSLCSYDPPPAVIPMRRSHDLTGPALRRTISEAMAQSDLMHATAQARASLDLHSPSFKPPRSPKAHESPQSLLSPKSPLFPTSPVSSKAPSSKPPGALVNELFLDASINPVLLPQHLWAPFLAALNGEFAGVCISKLTVMSTDVEQGEQPKVVELINAMQRGSGLTEVDFSRCPLGAHAFAALSDWLAASSSVTSCDLSSRSLALLGTHAVGNLAIALEKNCSLRRLDLSHNKLSGDECLLLSRGLKRNGSLESLNLSSNPLGTAGVMHLAHVLTVNSTLCHLDLQNVRLARAGGLRSFRSAQQRTPHFSLVTLDLSGNRVGDEGVEYLAEMLRHSPETIEKLYLMQVGLTCQGVVRLAESLRTSTRLAVLHLTRNRILEKGTIALCNALKENASLRQLSLCDVGLGPKALPAVAEMLAANQTLRWLNLSNNGVCDEGAAILARALLLNKSLQNIDLCAVRVSCKGASALADSLSQHPSLSAMNLACNLIRQPGAHAVSLALRTRAATDLPAASVNLAGNLV